MQQTKFVHAVVTLLTGAAGIVLVMHYPLGAKGIAVAMLVGFVACYMRPDFWLQALPALLPIVGFAPWTGWLTFEELDLVILVAATGGYARLAWPTIATVDIGRGNRHQIPGWFNWASLLSGLFALSVLVGMYRGFVDAGGFSFGWFQGYHEPMNSVRVGKSFFFTLLVVPLWQVACKINPERSQRLLSMGLMLGLAAAAFTTVWERAAFVDLMNFSADYRTTAMFWEMHVGGAALDGFLALTVPFALREWFVARSPWRWGLAAAVLGLAAYACLTTFSRGVYLALPVGLGVFFWLNRAQGQPGVKRQDATGLVAGVLLVVGFGVGVAWMFQSSGYRGMAALLGAVALMLPLAQVLRGFKASHWVMGVVAGLLLILVAMAMFWMVPKGAYVAWGLAALLTAVMLWFYRRGATAVSLTGPMALGGFLATVAGTALVAAQWGDNIGLQHSVQVLLVLLGVCGVAVRWRSALWPEALRWQASIVGAMLLIAAAIGVMGGGAYMGNRFSTGGQDLEARLAHWQLGRSMLTTPADWLFGKGLGRFPANYFLAGNPQQRPGDYRLGTDGDETHLTLTAGLQIGADVLRVSQRVAAPGEQAVVTARVQAESDLSMLFEVCEKHLLYSAGCMAKQASVKGAPGIWQDLRVELQGNVSRGDWYAPRLIAFSMGVASLGGKVNIDDVALTGADGLQLLNNGNFLAGMKNWVFSSDRSHLPWHIKSLYMSALFDQGLVGLTLWLLLYAAALWRLSLGQARWHPLAPALAAALVGFAVVGLFDSLLDVPRVAWLYYFLVLVSLTLPPLRVPRGTP